MFSFFKKKPLSPDGQVIEQLRQHGSDLSKLHEIDFFFYFPEQMAADRVAGKLTMIGFSAEASLSTKGDIWVVQAKKAMVPVLADLEELTVRFKKIAADENGDYDGWGCPIVM